MSPFGSQEDSRQLAVFMFSNMMNSWKELGYEGGIFAAQAPATGSRKVGLDEADFGAKTETEALDRALSSVVSEADIDKALGKVRGKGRLRKGFR